MSKTGNEAPLRRQAPFSRINSPQVESETFPKVNLGKRNEFTPPAPKKPLAVHMHRIVFMCVFRLVLDSLFRLDCLTEIWQQLQKLLISVSGMKNFTVYFPIPISIAVCKASSLTGF